MKTGLQATCSSLVGFIVFGLLLLWPAGTFAYWQGWVVIAIFLVLSTVFTIYLGVTNPDALRRRMHGGPLAEARTVQKFASAGLFVIVPAVMVISAFDHRFGWSTVPPAVWIIGDVLVAIGLGLAMLVVVQNSYAAANINVEADQKVVSTGLYGLVRHPMYVGLLIMMAGIPLALDSYCGLVGLIPILMMLAVRILDEEEALNQQLVGYPAYTQQVHYRLMPHVW
jgi:protein-S-isoprenylcysteine O-methyltransferase Ste14